MYVHFSKCVMWQFEVFVKGLFWASGGLFLSLSLSFPLFLFPYLPRERERERERGEGEGGRGGPPDAQSRPVFRLGGWFGGCVGSPPPSPSPSLPREREREGGRGRERGRGACIFLRPSSLDETQINFSDLSYIVVLSNVHYKCI